MTTLLLIIIIIAGLYMAWNIGANDVANAMGTSVGSGALSLKQAVVIAGVLEFSGAFFFGSHVSETIESGIINAAMFQESPLTLVYGMIACLISAGAWLQIASYFGWPVSTTHSIVGAIVGFGLFVGGVGAIHWKMVSYIVFSWILSPLFGGIIAYLVFSQLLKRIFYVAHPLRAAKQMIPPIVFFVMFTLSLAVVFNGLGNIYLSLSSFQAIGLSVAIGLLGAFLGWLSIRQIEDTPLQLHPLSFNPKLIRGLDKAQKHLQGVQAEISGELGEEISRLIDQTQELSMSLKQAVESVESRSEFDIVERLFAKLQLLTACLMAFSHGANDVANAIGPLVAAVSILQTGIINGTVPVPLWALGLGGIGIVLGLATWGWRVIETIGRKLTKLTPTRGFSAEFGAAATILVASRFGFPISATHTLVGAVLGVGFARGIEALNMRTMRDIVISWIVTIPIGAGIAIGIFYVVQAIF